MIFMLAMWTSDVLLIFGRGAVGLFCINANRRGFEHRGPGQARLGALEDQELEQDALVVLGYAPFLVVVGDVDRIIATPRTARRYGVHRSGGPGGNYQWRTRPVSMWTK